MVGGAAMTRWTSFGHCFTALGLSCVAVLLQAAKAPLAWPSQGDYQIDSDTTTTSQAVVETWRRVDDRTWERTLKATVATYAEMGMGVGMGVGMGMGMGVSAGTGISAAAATTAAMALVIKVLEEMARTGSADQNAAAQQELAMLSGSSAPQGSGGHHGRIERSLETRC